ncbi:MAG: flagellar hook-associated protein FlgK [Chromatiales bacterium]|nr:flagellar hook-associated protein FlgK [Gammaproteobacteria bacterium]MCP5353216.1 flagellar hook-associated protein FlgK [Chromatiales bacterium]
MASTDAMSVGLSGLRAAQQAINTTGHNIANVGTDGYSRQSTSQVSGAAIVKGASTVGLGVTVTGTARASDRYLSGELTRMSAEFGQADTQYQLNARLDSLLSSADTGLAGFFNTLGKSAEAVSASPASLANRQVLIADAGQLAQAMNAAAGQIESLTDEVNDRLRSGVADVNALSARIARLNDEIGLASASGKNPNDLLDQRDQLVNELAGKTNIRTLNTADNGLDILTSSGESLVHGGSYRELATTRDPLRPDRVLLVGSDGNDISRDLNGGELSGLLNFRDQVLNPARDELGRLSAALAHDFNSQHALGIDLDGNVGGDFFSEPAPRVTVATGNTGSGALAANIADGSALTTSEYTLTSVDGANLYTLTRLSDNQTFSIDTAGADPYTTAELDGLTLDITAGAAAGDSFLIQPVQYAAQDLSVEITDARKIAAANPVVAEINPVNAGSGAISNIQIADMTSLPLSGAPVSGDLTLTFDATLNQYTLNPDPFTESPIAFDPGTDSGGKTVSLLDGAFSFTLSGTPGDGDELTLSHNADGTGDNRNADKLKGILNNGLLDGGTTSLTNGYASLVAQIGSQTQTAETSSRTFSNMLSQVTSLRESMVGVNLDEEAANLIKFQQAYQASAQVISTAESLFSTLLQAVGR